MSIVLPVLFPIFVLILIGFVYAKYNAVNMETANRMNMEIFIPALLIDALSRQSFSILDYKTLALVAVLVILSSGVLAWLFAKAFKLSVPMFVPSMMFNNSGNMGLPLAVLAFGEDALSAAVILFLAENLLHFTLGTYIVNGKISWWNLLKMPVNIATIIGLVLSFTRWEMPEIIYTPIHLLAQIVIPLMLVSLGVRMTQIDFSAWRIGLIGAVVCPLVSVIPAFIILLFIPLEPMQRAQLLVFATLPPAVLNFMFAEKYQKSPIEVASIVAVGNGFSIVSLSLMLLYLA
ncbi:MAG TPA: AEC family transporter [Leucothrix sp.]|nr:AEC family transporter [Leucothrix sp.]